MISAVLLFNEADNQELIKLSEQINELIPSLIKLDSHFLPHITLVQFNEPDEAAFQLWRDIKHLKQKVRTMTSDQLHCKSSPSHDQVWIELDFIKSDSVGQLQEEIMKTDFAGSLKPHNGTGNNYHPHCTLALLEGRQVLQLNVGGRSVFNKEFSDVQLVVGLNGENFTFIEPKFS